jgi:hypothetical protein
MWQYCCTWLNHIVTGMNATGCSNIFVPCLNACVHIQIYIVMWSWNNLASTGQIFMNFDISLLFKNMLKNLTRITGTLCEDLHKFKITHWILLRMRNISDKICRANQNTYFMFNNIFPTVDALLHFHCKNGYANVPQCYTIHTLPILLNVLFTCIDIFRFNKFRQAIPVMNSVHCKYQSIPQPLSFEYQMAGKTVYQVMW